MERFVADIKIIKDGGNSKMVYIMQEARQLSLGTDDEMFVVCSRKEDRDFIMSRLYSQGSDLYFIVVLRDDDSVVYDIRSSISELELSRQFGDELITVIGPFDDLHECIEFKFMLEEKGVADAKVLKQMFKDHVRSIL